MPVYNEEKLVESVIDMVKKADIGKIQKEIVVVDDCSTDNTLAVLKNIKNIKLITHTKNVPISFPISQFDKVKDFVNKIENLFLIGRNGMHRYNNMDHSMLSAMTAVSNIYNGLSSKDNIWLINAEEEYHESK